VDAAASLDVQVRWTPSSSAGCTALDALCCGSHLEVDDHGTTLLLFLFPRVPIGPFGGRAGGLDVERNPSVPLTGALTFPADPVDDVGIEHGASGSLLNLSTGMELDKRNHLSVLRDRQWICVPEAVERVFHEGIVQSPSLWQPMIPER